MTGLDRLQSSQGVDEWQYHQDGRDAAVGQGCLAILCILAILAIGALVLLAIA